MVTETIEVRGMHCGGCERRLRAALLALPGVAEAVPEHIGDMVEVTFDPGVVDLGRIGVVVEGEGFRMGLAP